MHKSKCKCKWSDASDMQLQMERPIRIECRKATAHNERSLVDLIDLENRVQTNGWSLKSSPFYNQQIANLKAHIEEAKRWSDSCDNHSWPRQFVNRLTPKDADTLVWRVDLPAVKTALGVTPAFVAVRCTLAGCACCNIAQAEPEVIDLTGDC